MTLLAKLTTPLVNAAVEYLDKSISQERIRKFLQASLTAGHKYYSQSPDHKLLAHLQEFEQAYALGREIRLANLPTALRTNQENQAIQEIDPAKWIEALPKGRMVSAKGLTASSGSNLLILLGDDLGYEQLIGDNMERLLRHVEVKREQALQLDPPAPPKDTWMEKHAVSVAFSRWSRRHGDMRYLNAALKLNDWALPSHARSAFSPVLVRFLLALAEAEFTLESWGG